MGLGFRVEGLCFNPQPNPEGLGLRCVLLCYSAAAAAAHVYGLGVGVRGSGCLSEIFPDRHRWSLELVGWCCNTLDIHVEYLRQYACLRYCLTSCLNPKP